MITQGQKFRLAPVSIVSVADIDIEARRHLETCREEDFVVSVVGERAGSKVVSSAARDFLLLFSTPRTIVDAVIERARLVRKDPERLLQQVFPLLNKCIAEKIILSEDEAPSRKADFLHGQRVGGFTIERLLQASSDSAVYVAKDVGGQLLALKIAKTSVFEQIAREQENLSRLQFLDCVPRMVRGGRLDEGQVFVASKWVFGGTLDEVARTLRTQKSALFRMDLIQILVATLKAYCSLHEAGWIHGDVHPRNVLVPAPFRGQVVIVDFGLSHKIGESGPPRGGVPFYLEPEAARRILSGNTAPPASAAGEQFALGALIYYALTGQFYTAFSLERERLLRQVVESPPTPFAEHRLTPSPEIEAVLATALSKEPARRFGSTRLFLTAFEEAVTAGAARGPAVGRPSAREGLRVARDLLDVLVRPDAPAAGLAMPPRASLYNGAAGMGYLLWRASLQQSDGELLAAADAWSARSVSELRAPDGLCAPDRELSNEVVSGGSVFHGPAGVWWVRALIASSIGDDRTAADALSEYAGEMKAWCDAPKRADVLLGGGGLLLGAASLLECMDAAVTTLRTVGNEVARRLVSSVDEASPFVGMAHGTAGILLSLLRWSFAAGWNANAEHSISAAVHRVIEAGQPTGRFLRFPWVRTGMHSGLGDFPSGWCNGTAGYLMMFVTAYRTFGASEFLDAAERCAWYAAEDQSRFPNLCCGLAGRAYALMAFSRATSDTRYLELARRVAADINPDVMNGSLMGGKGGIALLELEIEEPETAAYPVCESFLH